MPAAVKSTSFLHLATIGYLGIEVQGILAEVKLRSKPIHIDSIQILPFHASAYVIFWPSGKNPLLINIYFPTQL